VDAYGAESAPDEKFEALKEAGGKVGVYNSLVPLPWKVTRTAKRTHRRAFIIDGRIGYTGGAAIDDVWLGNARNPEEWRDLMFRFEGPMVGRLQGSFAETWAMLDGELLAGEAIFPSLPQGGPVTSIPLSSVPSPDLFESQTFVLLSLLGARRQIAIETPYFLSDPPLREILKMKARAGVSVRIIVPNEHNDQDFVRWAGQRVYTELMEAGIEIHEYQPTFTHAKLMVVDGAWSLIGSANMDHRSRKINDELQFGIRDEAFAQALLAIFEKDLRNSKRVRLEEWRRRGILQRALEWGVQLFVQQY
jgi:cardiolipin synthase A/B